VCVTPASELPSGEWILRVTWPPFNNEAANVVPKANTFLYKHQMWLCRAQLMCGGAVCEPAALSRMK
jgi:hypothetical protein